MQAHFEPGMHPKRAARFIACLFVFGHKKLLVPIISF